MAVTLERPRYHAFIRSAFAHLDLSMSSRCTCPHMQKDARTVSDALSCWQLCGFVAPCTEAECFTHLRRRLKLKQTPDITAQRTVVLKGRPVVLGEDSGDSYKTCLDSTKEEVLVSVTGGVLTVLSGEGPSSMQLQPKSTAIVLEGNIVLDGIKTFPGSLLIVWTHVCRTFGLSKMQDKLSEIHPNGRAGTGKLKSPT